MRLALLALVALLVSGCSSTKATSSGPCPERNEPLAGSMCPTEGTQCEYVVGTCTTDTYVCTSGKWAMADMSEAGCLRPPRLGYGGDAAADGQADGAAEASTDAASE